MQLWIIRSLDWQSISNPVILLCPAKFSVNYPKSSLSHLKGLLGNLLIYDLGVYSPSNFLFLFV